MIPLWIINTFVGAYGFVAGSFVTAWLWRIKSKGSISKGRSKCPNCEHTLSWFELIPFFSFLFQRGKCRHCKQAISIRYPVIELTTALLFIFVFNSFFNGSLQSTSDYFLLISLAGLLVSAVLLFFYDLFWMILPNQAMIVFGFSAILYALTDTLLIESSLNSLFFRLLCAVVIFLLFYGLYQLKDGKYIGGGDVKLLPLLGLMLGFEKFFLMLFLASVLGSIVGITIIFVKKSSKPFPFGPFLLGSFIVLLTYGDTILNIYTDFILGY